MSARIELHTAIIDGSHWVYSEITDRTEWLRSADDACEHFVRLLITTGAEPQFVYGWCEHTFKLWLNKQPNKTELIELLNLRELVR